MLNRFTRAFFTRLFTPIAALLLRLGVSPDAVTVVGTAGVCAGALAFFPRGELFWGVIVITAFVFSDSVDGVMARMSGRTGRWGSFLDSTLDRVADGAVFAGLVLWFAVEDELVLVGVALACLVLGGVVSYAKARAEGLGMTANVGGLGVPYVLEVVLWALAALSLVTVVQRVAEVHRQASALPGLGVIEPAVIEPAIVEPAAVDPVPTDRRSERGPAA